MTTSSAAPRTAPTTALHEDRLVVPLDRRSSLALLRTADVARLVFTVRALPEVMPVHLRVVDDEAVIRVPDSSCGTELTTGTVVALQADRMDPRGRTGWSVTVVGRTSDILEAEARMRLLALPPASWAGGARDRLIRVPLVRVTGRRLVPDPTAWDPTVAGDRPHDGSG